jgi:hypothetical protein
MMVTLSQQCRTTAMLRKVRVRTRGQNSAKYPERTRVRKPLLWKLLEQTPTSSATLQLSLPKPLQGDSLLQTFPTICPPCCHLRDFSVPPSAPTVTESPPLSSDAPEDRPVSCPSCIYLCTSICLSPRPCAQNPAPVHHHQRSETVRGPGHLGGDTRYPILSPGLLVTPWQMGRGHCTCSYYRAVARGLHWSPQSTSQPGPSCRLPIFGKTRTWFLLAHKAFLCCSLSCPRVYSPGSSTSHGFYLFSCLGAERALWFQSSHCICDLSRPFPSICILEHFPF